MEFLLYFLSFLFLFDVRQFLGGPGSAVQPPSRYLPVRPTRKKNLALPLGSSIACSNPPVPFAGLMEHWARESLGEDWAESDAEEVKNRKQLAAGSRLAQHLLYLFL